MNIFQFLINVFCKKHKPQQTESVNENPILTMKELSTVIRLKMQELHDDLVKYENGNKAAGKRARKATIELVKLFKEFRKRSVHETPEKE